MLMTTPSLYAPFGLQKVDPTFDQQLLCQLLNVWPGPQIREMLGLVATMDFGWWSGCLYSREGFDDRVLVGCSCRHQPRISGF